MRRICVCRVPVAQLAETVGITMENTINSRKNAAIIGCLHKEKEHKSMKKAAIIGQRRADNLKSRKDQLRKGREFKILHEAFKILQILHQCNIHAKYCT